MNIEDTLQPETLNEILLVNRIRELHRIAWEAGRYTSTWDAMKDPNNTPMEVKMITPTLRLAATAEASLEFPRGLRIEAHTHGPNRVGVANYLPEQDLGALKFFEEAQLLTTIHKKVLHQTAKLVQDHFARQG